MPPPPKATSNDAQAAGKPLVIVESPAKARTIAGLLGPGYVVESSVGHIRDLPRGAQEVPAAYKGEVWARLGVDVDNGFKPLYVVASEKRDVVARLKALVKQASEVFLATDEDREGESIAWHLSEVLAPTVPVKRMVFHEITPAAIERAVHEWRELDRRLVDAQEARRILDRLYGYELSPVLWKKVMPRLSAGRVQSVATRMVVERERARMRFRAGDWWDLEGTFDSQGQSFGATLASVGGVPVASGRDFSETGDLTKSGVVLLGEAEARGLAQGLADVPFTVKSVSEKPFRRSPTPPFMTSTLQQEAGRKLRFGAQRTMQVAQRLYEQGWITYMRTDSTTLSDEALAAARRQAAELYGPEYVPDAPRRYERKVKNAQEAHEAIRPAGDAFRTPDQAGRELNGDSLRLYDLIWKRTVASQMADATGTSAQVRLVGTPAGAVPAEEAEFAASGTVIAFPGFLRAYVEGSDDPDAELSERDVQLPPLRQGDGLRALDIEAKGHSTQPPARYTEASLVKALEEAGVGRPSTYASIIGTIQDRGYVWKKGTALVPSFTAFAVVGLLERHFSELVDYGFTAAMEDDLDEIAEGSQEVLPWLTRFYFGDGDQPQDATKTAPATATATANGNGNGQAVRHVTHRGLKADVATHLGEIDARAVNSIPLGPDSEGRQIVVRVGRYGPYLQRGDERASVPDDVPPDELTVARAEELLVAPSGDRELGNDPGTGLPVLARSGRYGPYVQLGDAADGEKPRTASLFKTMSVDTVDLEQALELLRLPRAVGIDPASGEEIQALNGRFGPYLKKGTDTRSLEAEEQLLSVSLDEALALFAQPKTRRGRGSAQPLREVGPDPDTGAMVVLRSGRFGPYVTDGTTNASLRKGDDPETITIERAGELLADRRAAGPPAKRARGVKKAAAKKAAAKKAPAKKAPAKKASPKKAAAHGTAVTGPPDDDGAPEPEA
ncbi:MAG TPA: type I DNA topoisomerase [Acidimicrobiales bacterium]|nr:type I DNA topoisomerase [Acidimicrobiales bacterium]